jgi:CheY-like chemotaxis protein
LVVDDERDARELIAAVFEELGATVAQVTGSDDAMAVVHGFHPEVIIADVGMPGGDGYSLLRTIRSFGPERGGSIRAIAVTSYARAEDKQRALEAGFDLHMAKPVDVPLLIDAVTGVRRISVGADDRMKQ